MTYCPDCGKEQGHVHIGWKHLGIKNEKKVCIRQLDCIKCRKQFIVIEFNNAAADEVTKMVNKYMNFDDKNLPTGGCPSGCP